MARSLGPAGFPTAGTVTNASSRNRYDLTVREGKAWLTTTDRDGGRRRQRIVGRVGAGIFDTSWVSAEVNPFSREEAGLLFFAPVETVTGRGLELAPFDLHPGSPGPSFALTESCLTCHTDFPLEQLPNAATGAASRTIYPSNALGSDAFERLSPLTCEACHGDASAHLAWVLRPAAGSSEEIGIQRLGRLTPEQQRDVCARCHLQGDVRVELISGRPAFERPLAAQIPVLVPTGQVEGFRFVGQMEQLAQSRCFVMSSQMTCTTCHLPHTGVAAQGRAAFDRRCRRCHEHCSRPQGLTVFEVTGAPARSESGCVDCHVSRDQPYDLPHVRATNHYIRRRIDPPGRPVPHRQFADPGKSLQVFDDGRLKQVLAKPAGRLWQEGLVAMGLLAMGRLREAATRFDRFPEPGSQAARLAAAPAPLQPLQSHPDFHQARALVLQALGRKDQALAAFNDALVLDPHNSAARLGKGRLLLGRGDLMGALKETDAVQADHPRASALWDLRLRIALKIQQWEAAVTAFKMLLLLAPYQPDKWDQLGRLLRRLGRKDEAREAFARARQLRPSPSGQ